MNKNRSITIIALIILVFVVAQAKTNNVALRMGIWDMTEDNPIPERAEIWIKGSGSWYFKKTLDEGKPVKVVGGFSVGVEYSLSFYPASRSGEEIIVLFKLTAEMNPAGSVRDSLWVSYSDDEVKVSGLPITAATGKTELKFKRK